ncbi:hypothetical protein R6Q57_002758 [Mikania cordata]
MFCDLHEKFKGYIALIAFKGALHAQMPAWLDSKGPRLQMYLKIFPVYSGNSSNIFNRSEVLRIRSLFTQWEIPNSDIFGPYELLNFTLLDPYKDSFL